MVKGVLPKIFTARNIEIIAVIIGFMALFLSLAIFAPGGPLSSDVTAYMNLGLNGIKSAPIMNRYFHILFQALFLKLAPTPLIGVQYFWAFLIAGTSLMVYLSARFLSRNSRPMQGILAVALFLSIGTLADSAGIAYVDITAMFMVSVLVFVYITSARRGHASLWLVSLFGFLFFLAIRTKETTIAAGVLLVGYGFTPTAAFDWKILLRRLIYFAGGIVAGIITFAILDWIFLGDPLFGLRLSEINTFLQTYVHTQVSAEKQPGTDNWYTAYFLTGLFIPFVIYLVSGAKAAHDLEIGPELRLVWLLPLTEILFVTITIGNQWGFLPRFIYPALPVICLLGPQFLNLNLQELPTRKARLSAVLLVGAGFVMVVFVRLFLRYFIPKTGWDIGIFLDVVFIPVLLSVILAIAFLSKRISITASIVVAILIIAIVAIPIAHSIKTVAKERPNQVNAMQLLYPFSSFTNQIHYRPGMVFYIGQGVWEAKGQVAFVKDRNEISALFNVYFDAPSTRYNFDLSNGLSAISRDLLSFNFPYALLRSQDWQTITEDPSVKSQLENKYQISSDKENLLVLLIAK